MVSVPIRPQYMLTVRMSFAIQFQFAHSPVDRPQVVKADDVSKSACNRSTSGCTTVRRKHDTRMNVPDIIRIVVALSTNVLEMAL